ncbi:hypothetical protein F511_36638 [Dorcoceras hygrometricum]|uniref:Uncharacterized protein n=1 Tax=Dorcoceras hygrometricum TaxID=472368 RepID=A0A2Z7CSR9_9LAMI|nr:hypothetical protein F511_36638 [Dorcoceras hygrometricum]
MLTEAHGWEPRSTKAITIKTTYWKLKPRLGSRSHHKGTKFYLHYKTHDRQQLRVPQLANHSLQKWYGMEELPDRSPTLPKTYQTIAGNDGKLPEKLTVNSTRVRRTEVDNRENISLMPFTRPYLGIPSTSYATFNPYIPIRSTTIGKSRVVRDPIAMHTSWRSNSDIDIHACKRAVNPRQRSIDSYMHRGLTQSRRLMTPTGCPVVGREMLATGFPNDWMRSNSWFIVAHAWKYCCYLLVTLERSTCWFSSSQRASAESLARRQNVVLPAEHDDVTDDIITNPYADLAILLVDLLITMTSLTTLSSLLPDSLELAADS